MMPNNICPTCGKRIGKDEYLTPMADVVRHSKPSFMRHHQCNPDTLRRIDAARSAEPAERSRTVAERLADGFATLKLIDN